MGGQGSEPSCQNDWRSSMALSCGIVGLPNVGKSTIFNALTRTAQALAANYPFATIEPNVGEVPVPDERLLVLARLVKAKRVVPASMRFVDIAGLVRGASEGAGLGNAFLGHIRETDAVAMVVRCFEDANVSHVEGAPDPARDIEILEIEMALADIGTVRRRLDRLEREVRADPKLRPRLSAAQQLIASLERGVPARRFASDSLEQQLARELFLLTQKPAVYVANIDEEQLTYPGEMLKTVQAMAHRDGAGVIVFCGKIEAELAGLSEVEARDFRGALGIRRSGLDQLIVAAYDLLGLMTFLTAGEKEARAWTIRKGTKAPQAAGTIHSDLERGFIRAEIVTYDDYAQYKTMEAMRSAGVVRSEGKDYVMQEGDVANFKFAV